jgi:signal transduction histidine kinase
MPHPAYRSTLRRRLTLFYAALFFASGTAVLLIPLLSIKSTMHVEHVGSPGGVTAVAQHDTDLRALVFSSLFALLVMAVLSVLFGWLLAGRLLRPLRTITATARDISASNLSRRLTVGRRADEFAELGETLNDLFRRLEAAFDSQRHFVANASHELRTPLTAERALLQVALTDPDAPAAELRAACTQALVLGEQQEQLIDALLTLASSERGIEQPEPFDLGRRTGQVIQARHQEAERRQIKLVTTLDAAPTAGDPSLAESLISNLVDNALRHNVAGGQVDIRTGQAAGRATISVRNTGPVIPPVEVDRLFQPFQRLGTDRTSRASGHGLGLAIVQAIARAHQATLAARARPGGGLDITVSFPAAPSMIVVNQGCYVAAIDHDHGDEPGSAAV